MFNVKELIVLLTSALVLGYLTQFPIFALSAWMVASGLALIILLVNALGYKIGARFFDSNAEIHHWNLLRYGFNRERHLKHPFPIWAFLPLGLLFITWGFFKWLALIIFDVTPLTLRERRAFARVSEWDHALIAVTGLFFTLLLALVAKLLGYPDFARLSLYYLLFNLLPVGTLAGNRILFGSRFLWVFALIFALSTLVLFEITSILATIILAIVLAIAAVFLFYCLIEA